ncbi:hypothetical protein HDU92_003319 [Lobulomyces angularis]|nr:hypothetical protein HDU92_003319 [Lobulomyces angularis]
MKSRIQKKIAIIGDSSALGYGDNLLPGQPPGLARYLLNLIEREKNVRISWEISNLGNYYSTTRDWLPESEQMGVKGSKKLFKKSFNETSKFEYDLIIIVFSGVQDFHKGISPEETLLNLEKLIKVLSNYGIMTFIYKGFPNFPGLKYFGESCVSDQAKRTELLSEWLDANKFDHLKVGPEISSFEYKHPGLYFKDVNFSQLGYRNLAKDSMDVLTPCLVKIQFQTLRKYIK